MFFVIITSISLIKRELECSLPTWVEKSGRVVSCLASFSTFSTAETWKVLTNTPFKIKYFSL